MKRAITVTVASVLTLAGMAGTSAQESQGTIEVRIAKTNRSVIPFGSVDGVGYDSAVRVKLFRQKADGDRLVESKKVALEDDGSYTATLPRPARGTCAAIARVSGSDIRDEETFPCYIPDFEEGTAALISVAHSTQIDALIADSDRKRGYGLMYRRNLRADLGMAFLWDSNTTSGFWMKNTLLPLSIAFFDENGVILRILDMDPCAEDSCPVYDPGVTYRGALEVNQGAFAEWGISEGDLVEVNENP